MSVVCRRKRAMGTAIDTRRRRRLSDELPAHDGVHTQSSAPNTQKKKNKIRKYPSNYPSTPLLRGDDGRVGGGGALSNSSSRVNIFPSSSLSKNIMRHNVEKVNRSSRRTYVLGGRAQSNNNNIDGDCDLVRLGGIYNKRVGECVSCFIGL